MNYGTQYHSGDNPTAPTAKATTVTQTGSNIHNHAATDQRCRKGHQRQTTIRTGVHAANGFLKCTFLPKAQQQERPLNKNIEREFYHSLSQLVSHHGIAGMPTEHLGFPYNMALTLWDTHKHLREKYGVRFNTLRLVKEETHPACLVSSERYDTGPMLYYIPVIPIFHLLANSQTERAGNLLVFVCAYLYQRVKMPYYTQRSSYICWQYEVLSEWMEQDEDDTEEGIADHKKEIAEAEWIGNRMKQTFSSPKSLDLFKNEIAGFRPTNEFEAECLKLANEAYSLYTTYPQEHIFRHANYANESPKIKEDVITMDKYISFIADNKGWLYDSLVDMANNEFNEYGEMEEPAIYKRFDGQPINSDNLDFENRLFPLIEGVCYLLMLNNDKDETP